MTTASNSRSTSDEQSRAKTLADRLETAATVIWVSFLAFVVAIAVVPVVGVVLGVVPFTPPSRTPYYALVGLTLLGTVAFVAAGILDV